MKQAGCEGEESFSIFGTRGHVHETRLPAKWKVGYRKTSVLKALSWTVASLGRSMPSCDVRVSRL